VSKVWFFISEALGSLRRNYFMTAAALVTVFLSMLVLGIVLVFASTINLVLKDVERKVEVTVFIKDGVTAQQTAALQKEIMGWSEVKSATYVSKDEALARFKQTMQAHPEIWQSLDTNPLPASIEISLKNPAQATAVADRLQGRAEIDDVRYGRQTAERLLSVTSAIRNAFVVFIILLGVVAILLISNTIRLSIFARRQAVEIMKLVGATNWFIRWPFVIEGMTVGLVGAAAALAVVGVGADLLLGRLQGSLLFMTVPIQTVPLMQLSVALLGSGVIIGAIGSAVGLRRFLDV
jgi:cell division transport system permease protein